GLQHAAESRRVEAEHGAEEELVGLDPAAAVHLAARVRVLQLRREVLALPRLLAHGIGEVLVEGLVPGTLNHAAAGREVAARREREAGAFADLVDRLHERLAERLLADDERAIVILQRAGDDL